VALAIATFSVPVLEVAADFAGPGRGEYGLDVIALGRDTEINESLAYGLRHRGGYHFNDRFQLEAVVEGFLDDESQCAAAILLAGAVHFRPQRKVEPYLALGIGQASRDVEVDLVDVNDSGLAGHLMAGGRFFFTQQRVIALRVEAGLLVEDTFDTTTTHPSFSIGMTWRMGGP
jgi:hypothetical protein